MTLTISLLLCSQWLFQSLISPPSPQSDTDSVASPSPSESDYDANTESEVFLHGLRSHPILAWQTALLKSWIMTDRFKPLQRRAKEFPHCHLAAWDKSHLLNFSSSMPLDSFGPIFTCCILSIPLNFHNFIPTLGTRPQPEFCGCCHLSLAAGKRTPPRRK